jgi:hypothetical protein
MAANLMGGLGNLIPALRLLATLQLPVLRFNVMALGNLAALLALMAQLRIGLGINPLAAGATAQIRAALSPLSLLPNLNVSMAAAITPLPPGFNVSARALARLNFSPLLGLRLPNLLPLSLAASVAGSGGLAVSVPCASCGVAAALSA